MGLKIAIGARIQQGAFGGANQFCLSLSQYLRMRGDDVSFDLEPKDIDIVLLLDTRKHLGFSSIDEKDIAGYIQKKPDTIIVQRINECDERKNTKGVNRLIKSLDPFVDHKVYISDWLRGLFEEKTPSSARVSVIRNGGDVTRFSREAHTKWNGTFPIKLVTHHWGAHWNKGFEVYKRLDQLLDSPEWKSKIKCTYVGHVGRNIRFKNIRLVPPCHGPELTELLHLHDVYITASINEPAGMHHIEGVLCGLPVLYRVSGAVPEYCEGFGVPFRGPEDLESALNKMIAHYDAYWSRLKDYPHNSDKMCAEYYNLFHNLYETQKESILQNRKKISCWQHLYVRLIKWSVVLRDWLSYRLNISGKRLSELNGQRFGRI